MSLFRRSDGADAGGGGAADGAGRGAPSPDRTHSAGTSQATSPPAGGLDGLLTTGPVFPARIHGYDRLQVDNYVAWAESELTAARREVEHLLARYGACAAELEISRRLVAEAPRGRDVSPVTDRVRDILRLAADEASAMVDAAEREAEEILAEARMEADERLRKAHEIKEVAAGTADEMLAVAQRQRAEAAALLERAHTEAEGMVAGAAAEHDRLVGEVAEARDELTSVRTEIEALHRQRGEARSALRRLTEQIEAALALASAGPSERFLLVGNTVAEHPVQSSAGVSVAS